MRQKILVERKSLNPKEKLYSARLYVIVSSSLTHRPLVEVAKELLEGGAQILQLREKNSSPSTILSKAKELRKLTETFEVPFILNDYLEIALSCGADGVHLGPQDCSLEEARKILGPEKIIGISARSVLSAQEAEKKGADYLGVGAAFPTSSKEDAQLLGPQTIARILSSVQIPGFAIGGIGEENLSQILSAGISRAVLSSALVQSKEPKEKARRVLEMLKKASINPSQGL